MAKFTCCVKRSAGESERACVYVYAKQRRGELECLRVAVGLVCVCVCASGSAPIFDNH
jgi:hypothetical protein